MTASEQRPIGIVVAMEAELRHLRHRLADERVTAAEPWPVGQATLAGTSLVIVRSGMGMVNAAAGTEFLIGAHRPRAVLNFGCAGAHRRDVLPGDVVIGEAAINHTAMQILASGEERFRGVTAEVAGEAFTAGALAADPGLLDQTRQAALGWEPEPWPADLFWPAEVARRPAVVWIGPVASADVWTQQQARLDTLHARHSSLCEDMEAAAIAQVCALHRVPFLTVKDISNNEYHAASDLSGFSDFPTAEVGRRAAALLARVIARLGERG